MPRLLRRTRGRSAAILIALTLTLPCPGLVAAQDFDPNPAWPLCGRITESPPAGWTAAQGCPSDRWGDPAFSDFPLSDTFGPRQKTSEGGRYDHHRGLDIPAEVGTPLFALAAGIVDKSEDDTVQLEHLRPGAATCDDGGCWYSRYIHMSSRSVGVGQPVTKGQLVGYSGSVGTNFPHLHFETRSAPAFDPESAWQRDTVHPLAVLPYDDQGTAATSLSIPMVDASDPMSPIVTASVVVPATELDFLRLELEIYARQGTNFVPVDQPGATVNGDGYFVAPPWLDLHQLNFDFTHKDSSLFPWSSFAVCPYADQHGVGYDAAVHLDRARIADDSVGSFDGRWIEPFDMNADSTELRWDVTFRSLVGTADAADLCVLAIFTDVRGNQLEADYQCDGLFRADGFESGDTSGWTLTVPTPP